MRPGIGGLLLPRTVSATDVAAARGRAAALLAPAPIPERANTATRRPHAGTARRRARRAAHATPANVHPPHRVSPPPVEWRRRRPSSHPPLSLSLSLSVSLSGLSPLSPPPLSASLSCQSVVASPTLPTCRVLMMPTCCNIYHSRHVYLATSRMYTRTSRSYRDTSTAFIHIYSATVSETRTSSIRIHHTDLFEYISSASSCILVHPFVLNHYILLLVRIRVLNRCNVHCTYMWYRGAADLYSNNSNVVCLILNL